MLFNSHIFIFLFLPITFAIFYSLGRIIGQRVALGWLLLASLFFYGWWNLAYLPLLICSIIFNYFIGNWIIKTKRKQSKGQVLLRRWLVVSGIGANLVFLFYFKYANFFIESLELIFPIDFDMPPVVLPLAISFFTFQQISYLVETYRTQTTNTTLGYYSLFVTFFPQLIAGPIIHHHEILPQLHKNGLSRIKSENVAVGLTIFVLGLFKKVILADGIATYATPVFAAATAGVNVTFFEAWGGVLAYTFQIYYDFSGYSDMAIGLARLFGIILPINFDAPYQANSIIDFWRRWHITLSRFLRDYLYIPLGGSRKGNLRRYINIGITMLLGGLWHGAGWTFVIWGALHGLYLIINHLWRDLTRALKIAPPTGLVWQWSSRLLTFLAVVVAWVFFRANSISSAGILLKAMIGAHGFTLPETYLQHLNHLAGLGDWLVIQGWRFEAETIFAGITEVQFLLVLLVLSWFAPEVHHILAKHLPEVSVPKGRLSLTQFLTWQPNQRWAVALLFIMIVTILNLNKVSEFLYFQF